MKSFEEQELHVFDGHTVQKAGFVLFDTVEQDLRFSFSPAVGDDRTRMTIAYLEKEFRQMQSTMKSGIQFTPFSSLNAITSQLLPGSPEIYFAEPIHISAESIEDALSFHA